MSPVPKRSAADSILQSSMRRPKMKATTAPCGRGASRRLASSAGHRRFHHVSERPPCPDDFPSTTIAEAWYGSPASLAGWSAPASCRIPSRRFDDRSGAFLRPAVSTCPSPTPRTSIAADWDTVRFKYFLEIALWLGGTMACARTELAVCVRFTLQRDRFDSATRGGRSLSREDTPDAQMKPSPILQ